MSFVQRGAPLVIHLKACYVNFVAKFAQTFGARNMVASEKSKEIIKNNNKRSDLSSTRSKTEQNA